MADCALCDRPMSDTAYACHPCSRDRGQAIRDAAALLPDLDDAIARRVRMSDPAPRGRLAPAAPIRPGDPTPDHQPGYASGLPFDMHASAVADTVRNTVTTWARTIVEQVHADPPTDLDELMRWIAGRVDWVRYEPYAAEALDELTYAASLVRGAVDRPASRVYLGPCGAPDGLAGACPGELHAHRRASHAICRQCGTQHEVAARQDWLDGLVREHAYTAAEIAGAYPVRAERIRQWASRGRIAARGHDRYGRPMYRLSEVLDVAHRMDARRSAA